MFNFNVSLLCQLLSCHLVSHLGKESAARIRPTYKARPTRLRLHTALRGHGNATGSEGRRNGARGLGSGRDFRRLWREVIGGASLKGEEVGGASPKREEPRRRAGLPALPAPAR